MANNKTRSKHSYLTPAREKQLRRCKAQHGKNSSKCDKYRKSSNKKK